MNHENLVLQRQLEGYGDGCKIWPDHLKDLQNCFKHLKGHILDAGCSDGQVMELIQKEGFEVTGVDIAPKALLKAKLKGLNIFFGKAQELPSRRKDSMFIL